MWTVPSRMVLGVVCACATGAGCVFNSAGLSPRDAARRDTSRDLATDEPHPDGTPADDWHLESGTDGRRDQRVKDRSGKDVKPWPDMTVKPDTGGCLVEDFTSGSGQVQSKSGVWAPSNGALRQSQTGAGNYAVINGVTAGNYVVSALVTVNSLFSKPAGWVIGAALGVRVQSGTQTPEQWLCGIYPGSSALVVVHCNGGDPSTTCFIQTQAGPSIAVGQQVRVRARMVGTTLTCDLPQLGGGPITRNTGLTSGGPTLITQFVDASYDDLSVCPLP